MADTLDIQKAGEKWQDVRRLQQQFQVYHKRIDEVRVLTRLRGKPPITLMGQDMAPARMARAQSIVSQARSFFQSAAIQIEVVPKDNTPKEDALTSKLERWLQGTQFAVQEVGGPVYRDALWHYFESGQWILRTLFDVDLAVQGLFPFCVDAIDPRTFSFKKSSRGLMCAVIQEHKPADVVLHELMGLYEKAAEPQFAIPPMLRSGNSDRQVKVTHYYDELDDYFWVEEVPVYSKPHHMVGGDGRPVVPFQIAFANDIPATNDKPEEYGMGMVYPVLDMLNNEETIFSKITIPLELFYFPMMAFPNGNNYKIEQVYPGKMIEGLADGQQPLPLQANPNYQVVDQLQTRVSKDIERSTLPEAAFGPMDVALSGYAYTQALSGLQERLKDYAFQPELAYGKHLGLLLSSVGRFNTKEAAAALGLEGTDVALYQSAFSVAMTVSDDSGRKKVKTHIAIDEADIDGHTRVRVSLEPQMDKDETAKYTRAQIAGAIHLPTEYIIRDVLQVEQPDTVLQWMQVEQLRQTNQEYAAFEMDDALNQMLNRDTDLKNRFMAWRQAQSQVQAEQPAPAPTDPNAAQPQVDANGQPLPQGMQPPPPQDPNQMAMQQQGGMPQPMGAPQGQPDVNAILAQLPPQVQQMVIQLMQQGMSIQDALAYLQQMMQQQQGQGQPPMTGLPGQPPPAAFGQAPPNPQDQFNQQMGQPAPRPQGM